MINEEILREYDIRGVYGKSLSTKDLIHIGESIASLINGYNSKKLIIGHDGRNSSLEIKNLLINTIINFGIDIIDISLIPTPLCYYATKNLEIPNSIMITGSHNPQEYNGLKIILNNDPFYGNQIKNLNFIKIQPKSKKGSIKYIDIAGEYIEEISNKLSIKKNLNIIWDIGNGVVGSIIWRLLKKIPGNHTIINSTVDGEFPNHHPDPTVLKNNKQISNLIKSKNYDLGVSFDGDGDRFGILDNKGNYIFSDIILMMISLFMSKSIDNLTVVADVKCSQLIFDKLKENNINILMSKTGHSLIKNKIKETKAHIAGEMSGHMFFNVNYYGFDDALYSSLKFIEYLSHQKLSLEELNKDYDIYNSSPELKLYCDESIKFKTVNLIVDKIKSQYRKVNISELDGIRLNTKDYWFLIRASNTQNCLIFRMECKKNINFKNKLKEVINLLNDFDLDLSELISFNKTV